MISNKRPKIEPDLLNEFTKVAIVLGCSGAIGFAAVKLLAKHGNIVVGIDKKLPKSRSGFADFFQVDVTDLDGLTEVIRRLKKKYHRCCALVYCVGVFPVRDFEDYDWDLWQKVNATNVDGVFNVLRLLGPAWLRGGRIAIDSSGAAHLGSRDIGYSTSKAALVGLAKGLARQLWTWSQLVNSVNPGVMDSQMSRRMNPNVKRSCLMRTVLQRIGDQVKWPSPHSFFFRGVIPT